MIHMSNFQPKFKCCDVNIGLLQYLTCVQITKPFIQKGDKNHNNLCEGTPPYTGQFPSPSWGRMFRVSSIGAGCHVRQSGPSVVYAREGTVVGRFRLVDISDFSHTLMDVDWPIVMIGSHSTYFCPIFKYCEPDRVSGRTLPSYFLYFIIWITCRCTHFHTCFRFLFFY
jgi:hypothetical protein